MEIFKLTSIIGLFMLLRLGGFADATVPSARLTEMRPQYLLPACTNLQPPAGNKVFSHVYARGVQIYRWNGTAWDFVAPQANLYANAEFNGKVGIHYAGPTWESNSGSRIIARSVKDCAPNPNAIPWLLLRTDLTERQGIYNRATFVQRVNTVGGLPPTVPGTFVGAEARVPYTADYCFYRTQD